MTIAGPPVESIANARNASELAAIANDDMAELITKHPDRFLAAVACLPMNNIDAALREADRAIGDLGFKGVQIYTPINGKPIDSPEFMALYEKMAEYDLPIWIHPTRGRDTPDYSSEDYSRYRIFAMFGWPYETAVAMARLVFSGVLEKYPNIKFITHHCGSMVPYFGQRIASFGRTIVPRQGMTKPPIEYFKMFYGDTALSGSTLGLTCGYAFFGAEHLLFGTDMPFGDEYGDPCGRIISSVESMDIPDSDKRKIFAGNARRLLRL